MVHISTGNTGSLKTGTSKFKKIFYKKSLDVLQKLTIRSSSRTKKQIKAQLFENFNNKSRRRAVRRKANTIETEFIAYRFNIIT